MEKYGTLYKKQYGEEIFGSAKTAYYIYPREKLISEPIFPYFVLDGGAFHFANDIFCTVNSDEMLPSIMDGSLMDVFRVKGGGSYEWERSFEYTEGTGFRKKYEWQIWPQRLYMTIPLAHAFLRTGDRRYADRWLDIVRGWDKAHPYQPFDPSVHYIKTDMVWRDMQAAWRTLSLLHGLFMLQDAPFDKEDWEYLYSFIRLHAGHLLEESKYELEIKHAQNHVLQKGVALIMAGVMFPELEDSAEYIKYGRETVMMNLRGAIYDDGGSDEDSPSYSHFIARLYLEALLLLKNNGLGDTDELECSVRKQYEWLWQCVAPNGTALRISDSYGMDALSDIRRVSELIPLELGEKKDSVLMPDSGMAVMRRGELSLFVDSMEYKSGHQHAGRPQLLLYYGTDPIIVDAGCCSYDRWEFYLPLKDPSYHNIVYALECDSHDIKCSPRITEFDPESGAISTEAEISFGGYRYMWHRRIVISESGIVISDHAESDAELHFRSRLFIGRHDMNVISPRSVRVMSDDMIASLGSAEPLTAGLMPVMNDNNKIDYAEVLQSDICGKSYDNRVELRFEKR